jgi:Kef-type K+ transport system membrane component KefB
MVAAMSFDNLVAVLAVAAAVPLILAAMPRVPVPGPVLEIVAGIVLGPAVLDLVKPDQAVRLVSTIGLAFLFFLAGLEIDVRHFRGPRARLTGLALGLSALLALGISGALHAAGVVESPLLVGIILIATSLGLVIPILTDAGVADRPAGQFAIAGASRRGQLGRFALPFLLGPRGRHRPQTAVAVAAGRLCCPGRHRDAPHRALDGDHKDD